MTLAASLDDCVLHLPRRESFPRRAPAATVCPPAAVVAAPIEARPPLKSSTGTPRSAVVRDLVAILLATVVFALLSTWLNVGELLLSVTQPNEHYEVDEIPGVLVFVALAVALFAWRRMAEARSELARRLVAERELVAALDANRRLARENVRIQEDERRNLARELHDEFGQYLNAIKVDAVSLRDARAPATDVRDTALSIIGITDHVQSAMRETIARLRPAGLDELGLVAALEHCVEGWQKRLPAVLFELSTPADGASWDEAVNITLYRVVQEALTNVAKHAQAARVEIRLECPAGIPGGAGNIKLTITDDGRGHAGAVTPAGAGLGIVGMRERVEALGGRLDATPAPSGGFVLSTILPMRPRHGANP
jgi:two-component system sensor histidine kinase UhpB